MRTHETIELQEENANLLSLITAYKHKIKELQSEHTALLEMLKDVLACFRFPEIYKGAEVAYKEAESLIKQIEGVEEHDE